MEEHGSARAKDLLCIFCGFPNCKCKRCQWLLAPHSAKANCKRAHSCWMMGSGAKPPRMGG
eukprot:15276516-Alexandrium_andersonii.AAC.1